MKSCDFIINGASVIDGSGAPAKLMDIAVDREWIVALGDCTDWQADETVNATGLTLAPGFIDSHTHDDLALLDTPDIPFKISQGVTTVITGNCGISLAPLTPAIRLPAPFPLLGESEVFQYPSIEAYRDRFENRPAAVNVAMLTGHSSLRLGNMADKLDQSASQSVIDSMRESLRTALRQGCIGLSTGLDYPPAIAASTDEVVQLAKVLSEFDNAIYVTHMRDEGDAVVEAVEETLQIGRSAEVPVIISHHKCSGPKNYGRSVETLELIDKARSGNQQVSLDVYPYIASSTSLLYQFAEDSESVIVAESKPHPECNGKLLERVAAEWQCTMEEACERLYPASAIYFQMNDIDLERILAHPEAMIGSDGLASMQTPHPRLWGTFPRVLGHYVREKKLFNLETAIHKMTALTAKRFSLKNRGQIKPGNYADLVLFDPSTIIDKASFEQPAQICEGIHSVWVNGELGWHQKSSTGSRSGQFLTHQ